MFQAATPLEFPFRRRELTGEEPPPPRRSHDGSAAQRRNERADACAGSAGAEPRREPYYRIFAAERQGAADAVARSAVANRGPAQAVWIPLSLSFCCLASLLGLMMPCGIPAPQPWPPRIFARPVGVAKQTTNLTRSAGIPSARAYARRSSGVLEIEDGGIPSASISTAANLRNRKHHRTTTDPTRCISG